MIGAFRVALLGAAGGSGIHGNLGTVRSVSTSPTNANATAYANQKKEATLSTGREVMVIGDTTTNAQFWWSDDDWASKTQYTGGTSDLAGWSNGSIYPILIGSTECLCAIWKQSGTGGGRTDTQTYAAVGIFNAGRTTLTWGTPTSTSMDTHYNYADVVANTEGTGAKMHALISYNSGTSTSTDYARWAIDASGVITATPETVISYSTSITVANNTFPSLTIDPSKNLHGVWSDGQTGVGHGIRYKENAYSAGSWTPGTELSIDTTRYILDTTRYVVCRWWATGSKVIIGGFLYNGATNDLMQYELVSPFTSVGTTRTLSAAVSAGNSVFEGGMAVFDATGDVFYGGRNGAQSDVAYYWWVRATTTLGSRTVIQSANVTSPFVNVWPRATKIGFLWTALNSSPYTVKAVALT